MSSSDNKYKYIGKGLARSEMTEAKKKFQNYLENYPHLHKMSYFSLLEELIFHEALNDRIKSKIEQLSKARKELDESGAITSKTQKELDNNMDTQFKLKEKLGLFEDKTTLDAYKDFEELREDFKEYRRRNPNQFKTTCLHGDSKVLLPDFTYKCIRDLKIGDDIIGVEGLGKRGMRLVKQKVLDWTKTGKKPVIRLGSEKGRELICTPDHKIYSYVRGANNSDYFKADICFGRKLKSFYYIENVHKYYEGVLLGLIKSDGWLTHPKNKFHPEWDFSKIYNICQSPKTEYKTVEWILNYFNLKFTRSFNSNGWGSGAYEYKISTRNTDFIKNIEDRLFDEKNSMLGFLAGFVVGDGNINHLGNIFIIQKKEKEKLFLEKIFKKLNLDVTRYPRKNDPELIVYSIRKQIPFVVPESKKSKKFLKILFSKGQHFVTDKINKIEMLSEECEVYDITTETENFIANGVIVHNCPSCSFIFFLKRRTDQYEEIDSPWFKDKVLCNPELWKLYKAGTITREQAALVLGTSPDYIDWLQEKIFKENGDQNNEADVKI